MTMVGYGQYQKTGLNDQTSRVACQSELHAPVLWPSLSHLLRTRPAGVSAYGD